MKTKYHILSSIAALSIAGALCSCSEDYAADLAPGADVVRIASATVGVQSSAAVEANGFADGNQFLLSTSPDGNDAASYTLSGNEWIGTLYWSNDTTSNFYAAYPSTATYNSFSLPTDQSNGTEAANYMTAKQTNVGRLTGLTLNFGHKTARVRIKITGRSSDGLNDGALADPVIRSPHSGYSEAAVTGNAVEVTPQTTTETGVEACYTALVIPGEQTGFKLFSVEVGGKEVSFTTDVAFAENHIYEYTLTIGANRITLNDFAVSKWNNLPDKSGTMVLQWNYETDAENFAGGKGSKDAPFLIANAKQLLYLFLQMTKDGTYTSGNYFKLTSDIDLAGKIWVPIGLTQSSAYEFKGHFDGGGHVIRNMTISQSALSSEFRALSYGLFCKISDFTSDVSIRNLTIENASINIRGIDNHISVGIIAGDANCSNPLVFDNCHIKDAVISIHTEGSYINYIGGIIGLSSSNNTTFSRCTVQGQKVPNVAGTQYVGGVCGKIDYGNVQIYACSATNCELYGMYTGGLVGYYIAANGMTCKLEVSGSYADCTLNGTTKACIACGYDGKIDTVKPNFSASYFAGRGCSSLYTGNFKSTNVTDCSIFSDPSAVYGIVANPANNSTFTLDGTTYNVWECWQDNGNVLPTLKVSKGGSQQDN